MCFLYKANGLEHVRNVVEPANFGLESLFIDSLIISYLTCGLLERYHLLPPNKQVDELLAEVAERFDLLVFGLPLALLAHEAIFLIGGHLYKSVLGQLRFVLIFLISQILL